MKWNNGYERRMFEIKQKKQAEEYRKAGMTEEQIKAMYEFDLEQFNSDRKYYRRTQPFTSSDFEEGVEDDSESTLLEKFEEQISVSFDETTHHSRYWWIEDLENAELAKKIKMLTQEEIEILTMLVVDGNTQVEIAQKINVPFRTLKYKIRNIKNFLK